MRSDDKLGCAFTGDNSCTKIIAGDVVPHTIGVCYYGTLESGQLTNNELASEPGSEAWISNVDENLPVSADPVLDEDTCCRMAYDTHRLKSAKYVVSGAELSASTISDQMLSSSLGNSSSNVSSGVSANQASFHSNTESTNQTSPTSNLVPGHESLSKTNQQSPDESIGQNPSMPQVPPGIDPKNKG